MTKFKEYPKDGLLSIDTLIKPYASIIDGITAECTMGLVDELQDSEARDTIYDPPARTIPTGGMSLHESAAVSNVPGWPTEVEQVLLAVFRLGMEQGIRLNCQKNKAILQQFASTQMAPDSAAIAARALVLGRSLDHALVESLE